MNARQVGKQVKEYLSRNGIPFTKVKAHTVSFSDLARGSMIIVEVRGWKGALPEKIREALNWSKGQGFVIDFI